MFAKLKELWSRLAAPSGGTADAAEASAVEYNGYRIRPTPFRNNGQFQTCGIIEKDAPDGMKQHRFIRADAYPGREDAVAFTVTKAKQIIDLQGDRMFEQG
jgi:hypothetical protein